MELKQTDDLPIIGVIGGVGPYAGLDWKGGVHTPLLAAVKVITLFKKVEKIVTGVWPKNPLARGRV